MPQFCTNCGAEKEPSQGFCRDCGTQFGGSDSDNAPAGTIPANSPRNPKASHRFLNRTKVITNRILAGLGILILITVLLGGAIAILAECESGTESPFSHKGGSEEVIRNDVTPSPIPTMTPQDIKAQAVNIGYDPLYRNIETHVGKVVHLSGKAVQVVIKGNDRYNLRLAMDGDSGQIVWVTYRGQRVLEDDTVEVWGRVKGLYSYESIFGAKITIPEINSLIGVVNP